MTFPVINQRNEGAGSSSTTHTITYTQTTGDLIIVIVATAGSVSLSSNTDSFTDLSAVTNTLHIFYKTLTGSEGGTTDFVFSSATKSAWVTYNISGHSTTQAPELSVVATGASTAPNATTVTPTGGAKDYLWITYFGQAGEVTDDDAWVTGVPSSFGNARIKSTGTVGNTNTNTEMAAADYASNASSMDAGAWTSTLSTAWRARTVAIHPSGNATVSLTTKGATAAGNAPGVTADSNLTTTTKAATAAGYAPTISLLLNVALTTKATTATANAVAVTANADITPTTHGCSATFPTVPVTAAAAVDPPTHAAAAAGYTPTIEATAAGSRGRVSWIEFKVPLATDAEVHLDPLGVVATGYGPAVTGGATATATHAATAAFYAPLVAGDATVGLSTYGASAAFYGPAVAGNAVVSGSAAATATFYAPVVTGTANVTLTTKAATTTFGGVSVTAGGSASVNLVTFGATATGYAPAIGQGTGVSLERLDATTGLPTPEVAGGANAAGAFGATVAFPAIEIDVISQGEVVLETFAATAEFYPLDLTPVWRVDLVTFAATAAFPPVSQGPGFIGPYAPWGHEGAEDWPHTEDEDWVHAGAGTWTAAGSTRWPHTTDEGWDG